MGQRTGQDGRWPVGEGRVMRLLLRGEETASRYAARYTELAERIPALRIPLRMAALYVSRQGMLLASAVAFRTFLWLLPLALLVAGLLAGADTLLPGASADSLAATGVAGAVRSQITAALDESRRTWWVAVLIGLVLTLWTTRTLMRNLVLVNAHVWDVPVGRRSPREMLRATVVFALAWLAVLGGAAVVSSIDALLPGGLLLSFFCQAVLSAAGWLLVTLYLPDRRTSWGDVVPGAVLFGTGLALLHLVSRVYLPARIEKSSALYGSLGVAGSVLFVLLVVGQLVVLCAVLNRVLLPESATRDSRDTESGDTDSGDTGV